MGTAPETMTAAYVTELGGADRIRVGELPVPLPGAQEVLVRTRALAVNHVDTFVRSGAYPTELPFPFVIGRDLVGEVAAAGEGVTGFAPGDRVWCNSLGFAGRQGSFAEYALVPGERLYRLPEGADPVNAVATLHPAATAHVGLVREARLRPGETIVVSGAAGGVGSAVVQLAAAAGARVVATARPEDAAWCRDSGAAVALDYRDPDLPGRIAEAAPDGVDVYWENSCRYDFGRTLPLLARGGRVIVIAGMNARPTLPIGQLYLRDASLHGFVVSNATVPELAEAATAVNDALARGILRVRVGAQLPLAQAADAHRLLEGAAGRHVRGRIVLIP